ncbi:FISUMP domain-containing protein [Prevotella sp. 10(H)]|uniref:FISUMP domain-containing protein n=1 Tax=Prevotella sp. 10(H) TaxID=1158294 RepID=UPI0004A701F4|nr:FISUMP domain-containing protein [Prevotella sp. 10(H)]
MKISVQKTCSLLLFFILFFLSTGSKAQVTIGISEPANAGALLDLKEYPNVNDGSPNASKGLGLPRVKLTDFTNLYPMFAESDGVTPTAEYTTDKSTIDPAHVGLVVFHVDNCSMHGKGVYVWEEKGWSKIGKVVLPGVTLDPNATIIELPSGKDLRPLSPTVVNVTVGPDNNTATLSQLTNGSLGLIDFTANPLPATLPSATTPLQLLPDMMNTTSEVTWESPWFSKETKLSFTSECGTSDVILNQTNYAMKIGTATVNTTRDTLITFHGINQTHGLGVQTNVKWKVEVSDPDNILQTYTPASGTITGNNKSDGTINPGFAFWLTAKQGGKGVRFFKAYAVFSDTNVPKRFNDITAELRQCQGTEDLTAIEALPYETEYGVNKVIRHKDTRGPNGDYDYYSADFGPAGRWMTTNMSALTYDPVRTDGKPFPTITMYNDYNPTQDINRASWGYPTRNGGTDATLDDLYIYNPHYGVLYTYAAATGGRPAPAGSEFNQKYTHEGGTQEKVQGICPNGWHLPSDWEWTRLEKEIINNTTKYSTYTENIIDVPGGDVFNENQQYGTRGILHGNAMKDNCEAIAAGTDLSNYGTSKRLIAGGFSGLLAGHANPSNAYPHQIGAAVNFGHVGYFISASSTTPTTDSRRSINTGKTVGVVAQSNKYQLSSVRCVKDTF